MAAFEILGWEHELALAEKLCPDGLLACFSRFLDPPPPSPFLKDPSGFLKEDDLRELLDWMRSCRISMRWDFSIAGETSTLRVHREGTASPEDLWEVRIQEEIEENPAWEGLLKLNETGFPVGLRQTETGRFNLVAGPFENFANAREVYAALPPVPGMLLVPAPSLTGSRTLFWAAIQTRNPDSLPAIRFASEMGSARADLSTIARAAGAEGGINGGFFSASSTIGTLVVDGNPLRQSFGERSALGLSRGFPPVFGNGRLNLSIESANLRLPVDRLNEFPLRDEIALFLKDERFPVPRQPESGDSFFVPVTASFSGSFSLPPAEAVLFARGRGVESLKQIGEGGGAPVHANWTDPRFDGREIVLQAGPRIVENGAPNGAEESFDEKTRLQRHPRSLVGWDGNSLWWIVVDGRNPSHSLGLTLPECASLALSLGLRDALNLDGGGSSALWWKGQPRQLSAWRERASAPLCDPVRCGFGFAFQ
jgi:Exopolysaccharide biosynthesis protein related to N-acetylglucosamine-1-phosphodiester alpha-N-acetylglucosaminidase